MESRLNHTGPLCLAQCARDRLPLPCKPKQPIFSSILRSKLVTSTGLDPKERDHLRCLVQWMNGSFEGSFQPNVTHLIARGVGSAKYHVALEFKRSIVTPEWVEECWSKGSVPPEAEYGLPALGGLIVCSTGMSPAEVEALANVCNANGAEYRPDLDGSCTLLVAVSTTGSGKYAFAKRSNIPVVTPAYIHESVNAGFALRVERFALLDRIESDEPIKSEKAVAELPNTAATGSLSLRSLKSAHVGAWLDGCRIYLSGFQTGSAKQQEMSLLIRAGGGVRISIGSRKNIATHVVIDVEEETDLLPLKGTDVVVARGDWLRRCYEARARLPVPPFHPQCWVEAAVVSVVESSASVSTTLFSGLRFKVDPSLTPEEAERVTTLLLSNGGRLDGVSRRSSGFVGPTVVYSVMAHGCATVGGTAITPLWLYRCVADKKLVDQSQNILYSPLRGPFPVAGFASLVLCPSQYEEDTRDDVIALCKLLGARCEIRLKRNRTTHLICDAMEGDKYKKACEWGVVVVRKAWLVACAKSGRWEGWEEYSVTPAVQTVVEPAPSFPTSDTFFGQRRAPPPARVKIPPPPASWEPGSLAKLRPADGDALADLYASPSPKRPRVNRTLSDLPRPSIPNPVQESPRLDDFVDPDDALAQRVNRLLEQSALVKQPPKRRLASAVQQRTVEPSMALSPGHSLDVDSSSQLEVGWGGRTADAMDAVRYIDQRAAEETTPAKPRPSSTETESKAESFPSVVEESPHRDSLLQRSRTTSGVMGRMRLAAQIGQMRQAVQGGMRALEDVLDEDVAQAAAVEAVAMLAATRSPRTPKRVTRAASAKAAGMIIPQPAIPAPLPMTPQSDVLSQLPVVLFTSMSQKEKDRLGELVVRLKGEVVEGTMFNTRCTHVVVGSQALVRSEKLLAACASGKWVLQQAYVMDSSKANRWLSEDLYEIGGPYDRVSDGGDDPGLRLAPHRWRIHVAEQRDSGRPTGAYVGWHALLSESPTRKEGYHRLLLAGGATVGTARASDPDGIDVNATHVFFDVTTANQSTLEFVKLLRQRSFHCLTSDFIADYLTEVPFPSVTDSRFDFEHCYRKTASSPAWSVEETEETAKRIRRTPRKRG